MSKQIVRPDGKILTSENGPLAKGAGTALTYAGAGGIGLTLAAGIIPVLNVFTLSIILLVLGVLVKVNIL